MLFMQNRYFPLIDISAFKKILLNLHRHSRRSNIKLNDFKNKVAKLHNYNNFGHLIAAITNSKENNEFLHLQNKYNLDYSSGAYLLHPFNNSIRRFLEIPFDLYASIFEQQYISFCKKDPFLVVDGVAFEKGNLIAGLTAAKKSEKMVLICMAKDTIDAIACYWSTYFEEPIGNHQVIYDESDEHDIFEPTEFIKIFSPGATLINNGGNKEKSIRNLGISHLTPACANPALRQDTALEQLERPEVAIEYLAKKTKDDELMQILAYAKGDKKCRCRIYYDEFNSNIIFNNMQAIKAQRAYSLECSTPDFFYIGTFYVIYERILNKKLPQAFVKKTDITDAYNEIKAFLIKKYKNQHSLFILQNGVELFDSQDDDFVVDLHEALMGNFHSTAHFEALKKSFGISDRFNISTQRS